MWLSIILAVSFIAILWKLYSYTRPQINLNHIPGSTENMIWSIIRSRAPDPATFHLFLAKEAQKYGPVMKIPQMNSDPVVFLNDFETIYQALVKLGKETGGRPNDQFRWQSLFQDTGILGNIQPDSLWKQLRKVTHHHIKQYGDGLSPLEININYVAEKMFQDFEQVCGISYDPFKVISDTAMESIIYVITGQCLPSDHPIVVKMKEYDAKGLQFLSHYAPPNVLLLDFFPWLRHLGWSGYQILLQLRKLENEIWNEVIALNENTTASESITTDFRINGILDLDSRKSTLSLLFAGGTTTKSTFYGAVNLLAHYRNVQEKMSKEIKDVVGNQCVSLIDQPSLPYVKATVLEVLRYTSVAPVGAPHQSIADTTIGDYRIPKGTKIMTNLWNLHWDQDFWGDPDVFRPERFLDDAGQLVAADHPSRKHLMPFGAGTRVCVGETLAMSRLFLWMATLVQRFYIKPGDGNTKSKLDPDKFFYEVTLTCAPYNIILEKHC